MAEPTTEARLKRTEAWKTTLFRWIMFAQVLVLFVLVYVRLGGMLIQQTNHTAKDMFGGDQMHNMRIATETKPDLQPDLSKGFSEGFRNFFPHRTDGVVQPLWPWIAAWFTDADHLITDEVMQSKIPSAQDVELFNRGRWFHVFCTAAFLVMLGIAACRIFSFPAACNLMLLGGFGALLPRAAYFQPEPVYFICFFLTWVACVSALGHNTLWIYGLIGVVGGLAYMAKGSVEPLLAVFVGVSSIRCVWEYFSARRRGFVLSSTNLWHWRNHLVGLVVLALVYLMTVGPRLTESQERFGSMTHSYPSYWMWLDKFDPDCYEWMDQHNTRAELEAMLPYDKPSLGKYLRTHTREEAVNRLWNGLFTEKNKETGVVGRVREFFWPPQTKRSDNPENQKPWRTLLEWRGLYLAWLAIVLMGLLLVLISASPQPEHAGHVVFRHGTVTTLMFITGACVLYALAYAWYSPIARGSGDRFMLSLYLPLAFSLVWGAESIVRRIRRRKGSPWIHWSYLAAQWLLFAALCWRLIEVLRHPNFYNG
jgi:hypothetical protein